MSFRTPTPSLAAVRSYPFDLAVVSLVALLGAVVVTTTGLESPIRLGATLIVAFLLPGYALVSVLFPADRSRGASRAAGALDVVERLGLSVATSLALVPLVALALPATPWGLETEPIAWTLAAATIGLAQVGAWRRLRTPVADRFVVAPVTALERVQRGESGLSTAVLVLAIGLAGGALLLGILAPASAGGFTELGLYTETDTGELVAGEVPDELAPGEAVPLTIAIENYEGERTDYTVVVQEQRLEDGAVVERTALTERTASVADGETSTTTEEIAPTADEGESVRVAVLLFTGETPAEPTIADADVDTHVWLEITDE